MADENLIYYRINLLLLMDTTGQLISIGRGAFFSCICLSVG